MKIISPLLACAFLFPIFAHADSVSSEHKLSITVPEVRLLHIKSAPGGLGGSDNAHLITFRKHFSNGEDISGAMSYAAKGYYDITANVKAGTSKTRSIMVSAEGLGKDWKLNISSAALARAYPKLVTLTTGSDTGELVSGVGNVAMRDIELSYTLEPTLANVGSTQKFPDEGISLTFTLTDET